MASPFSYEQDNRPYTLNLPKGIALAQIYLGLGSNLGDREKNIQQAVAELNKTGVTVNRISTIIETEPEGGPPQGKYLNAVCEAQTRLMPVVLLEQIKTIEKKLGRKKTAVNGPRTIDIDILFYDDINLETNDLTIPHPRLHQRRFVLDPLKEIAPSRARQFDYEDR